MKKLCFYMLVFVGLCLTGCYSGKYYPLTQNINQNQTQVVLSEANFQVVKMISTEIEFVETLRFDEEQLKQSAYAALLREANLHGSQTIINVMMEAVGRTRLCIFPRKQLRVRVSGVVIEFINPNLPINPPISEAKQEVVPVNIFDESTLATKQSDVIEVAVPTTNHNEYAYVDLGLPSGLLWATCNIGASAPEDFGSYFAWGETTPQSDYSLETYKYSANSRTLPLKDDAAHVIWGGDWRMPTRKDFKELCGYCSWKWTILNGTNGYTVTGPNGNTVFFPAAGYRLGTSLYDAGSCGYYWSSSYFDSSYAFSLCFNYFNHHHTYEFLSYSGRPVRPVALPC